MGRRGRAIGRSADYGYPSKERGDNVPNIFFIGPYRFFFCSDERNEPAHVHIEDGSKAAKFWLHDAELARARGFKGYELAALRKLVMEHKKNSRRHGMSILSAQTEPLAVNVVVDDAMLRIDVVDGREIAAPLEWFPRLRDATAEQRKNWRLIGGGEGIHWPDIDEDISVLKLFGLPD